MNKILKLFLSLLYLAFWIGFMVPIFGIIFLLTFAKAMSKRIQFEQMNLE